MLRTKMDVYICKEVYKRWEAIQMSDAFTISQRQQTLIDSLPHKMALLDE